MSKEIEFDTYIILRTTKQRYTNKTKALFIKHYSTNGVTVKYHFCDIGETRGRRGGFRGPVPHLFFISHNLLGRHITFCTVKIQDLRFHTGELLQCNH